jgi:hypothetical protein
MSSPVGALIRRAALAACLLLVTAGSASAQRPIADPPKGGDFMPRFDWRMSAAGLAHEDERFSWDTHWAGDFDLVHYTRGRVTFLADYQALLGNEFRPFDPYQSNYLLEAAGSVFIGKVEVAGVLNHVSRHLGDRPKRAAVAENSLGPRVMRRFVTGPTSVDLRVDVRRIIQRSYVDYTWMNDLDLVVRRQLNNHVTVYGRGYGEFITVDRLVAGRDHQRGGRVEAGVWLSGRGNGAVELFGGYEQVIDADPLDRLPRRWAFAGFRLLGR